MTGQWWKSREVIFSVIGDEIRRSIILKPVSSLTDCYIDMSSDNPRDTTLEKEDDSDNGYNTSLPQQRFSPEEEAVSCDNPLPN